MAVDLTIMLIVTSVAAGVHVVLFVVSACLAYIYFKRWRRLKRQYEPSEEKAPPRPKRRDNLAFDHGRHHHNEPRHEQPRGHPTSPQMTIAAGHQATRARRERRRRHRREQGRQANDNTSYPEATPANRPETPPIPPRPLRRADALPVRTRVHVPNLITPSGLPLSAATDARARTPGPPKRPPREGASLGRFAVAPPAEFASPSKQPPVSEVTAVTLLTRDHFATPPTSPRTLRQDVPPATSDLYPVSEVSHPAREQISGNTAATTAGTTEVCPERDAVPRPLFAEVPYVLVAGAQHGVSQCRASALTL